MSKNQRRESKPPTLRRQFSKLSRAQAVFSILAVLVVCSLVATTVGTAVYDDLRNNSSSDAQPAASTSGSDPVLDQMRSEAKASPNDPGTLAALGNYLANTGNVDEAVTWYEKAITIKPSDADLRLDFGSALAKGEKFADAEVQFKKAIEIVPNYAQAYYSLGQLYLNWIPPRNAGAIQAFNKAVSIDSTSVVADRAREELSRIIPASPVASPPSTPAR